MALYGHHYPPQVLNRIRGRRRKHQPGSEGPQGSTEGPTPFAKRLTTNLTERPEKQNSPDSPRRTKILTTPSAMRKSSSHSNVPAMEQLFSSAAVDDGEENLALLPHSDDEHTLDLGIHLPNLCTAARRFRGPSPSPTPERPPERRRTTGIAAGNGSAPKSPF